MRAVEGRVDSLPDLGPRGEGWVAGQTALIVAVLWSAVATGGSWQSEARLAAIAVGAVLIVAGASMFVLGARELGLRFSIWMVPTGDRVVEMGPYAHVRHPICGGQILIGLGVALVAASWPALGLAAIYTTFVVVKSRHEEAMIERRLPSYADYRRRVPWAILPRLL